MNGWTANGHETIARSNVLAIDSLPKPSMRPIAHVSIQRNFALVNAHKTSQVVTRINFRSSYAPTLNCAGRRGFSRALGYTIVDINSNYR